MTIQAAVLILLACLCSGILLGTAGAFQAVQPKLRRLAEERRGLDARWREVRDLRRQIKLEQCPRCGWLPPAGASYPKEEDDEPDDND